MIYRVIEAVRLDEIVYNYYGSVDMLEEVLRVNKQYIGVMKLKAGDVVELPEVSVVKKVIKGALWD